MMPNTASPANHNPEIQPRQQVEEDACAQADHDAPAERTAAPH